MGRRFRISFLAVSMLAVGILSASAHADVTYTFSGIDNGSGGDGQTVGFQFTSANFVTSLTSLLSSQLTSCTHCQVSSSPDVTLAPNYPGFGDALQFDDSKNNTNYFLFSAGSFAKAGTYTAITGSILGSGTLTVSTVAVPEPGSVAFTFAGGIMLALVCLTRRKPMVSDYIA